MLQGPNVGPFNEFAPQADEYTPLQPLFSGEASEPVDCPQPPADMLEDYHVLNPYPTMETFNRPLSSHARRTGGGEYYCILHIARVRSDLTL